MTDAGLSVSKNQLLPQAGTVAATIAATGMPVARLRQSAAGVENCAARSATGTRSR